MAKMMVKKSDAVKLLQGLKFQTAAKLDVKKMSQRLNELSENTDIEKGKLKPEDKGSQNLLKAILKASEDDKEVVVVEEEVKAPAKAGKSEKVKVKSKGKGKAAADEDEDSEDDEDEEEDEESDDDEDEEDDEEEDSDEEAEDEDDDSEDDEDEDDDSEDDEDEEEDEKPSKKKVKVKAGKNGKASKKAKTNGEGKDGWGSRLGTATSKLNAAFGNKAKSIQDLEEEAGRGAIHGHIRKLMGLGYVVKDEKSGGYKRASDAPPVLGGKVSKKTEKEPEKVKSGKKKSKK